MGWTCCLALTLMSTAITFSLSAQSTIWGGAALGGLLLGGAHLKSFQEELVNVATVHLGL